MLSRAIPEHNKEFKYRHTYTNYITTTLYIANVKDFFKRLLLDILGEFGFSGFFFFFVCEHTYGREKWFKHSKILVVMTQICIKIFNIYYSIKVFKAFINWMYLVYQKCFMILLQKQRNGFETSSTEFNLFLSDDSIRLAVLSLLPWSGKAGFYFLCRVHQLRALSQLKCEGKYAVCKAVRQWKTWDILSICM